MPQLARLLPPNRTRATPPGRPELCWHFGRCPPALRAPALRTWLYWGSRCGASSGWCVGLARAPPMRPRAPRRAPLTGWAPGARPAPPARRAAAAPAPSAPRGKRFPERVPPAGGSASRSVFLVSLRVQATVFPCAALRSAPACGGRPPPPRSRGTRRPGRRARPGRESSDPVPPVPAGGCP